jgi:hypothetical protein
VAGASDVVAVQPVVPETDAGAGQAAGIDIGAGQPVSRWEGRRSNFADGGQWLARQLDDRALVERIAASKRASQQQSVPRASDIARGRGR